MIQESMQRDELGEISNTDEKPKPQEKVNVPFERQAVNQAVKPVVKTPPKPVVKPVQKPVAKQIAVKKAPVTKPRPANEKPKITMPKKNDY